MMRIMNAALERTVLGCAIAGMVVLGIAVAVTVADILLRKSVGVPVQGTIDIMQLCVMAAAAGAIPLAFLRGQHVMVDVATVWLSDRARSWLDAGGGLLATVFMAMLLWCGMDQAVNAANLGDGSQTIDIPMVWYWTFFLGGCALSSVAAASTTIRHLVRATAGGRA